MVLEDKDIIQIDATIIAGALVFLTISAVSVNPSESATRLIAVVIALGIILPFGLSAVQVASGSKEIGMSTMNYGFKLLLGMMIVYLILILGSIWPQVQNTFSKMLK